MAVMGVVLPVLLVLLVVVVVVVVVVGAGMVVGADMVEAEVMVEVEVMVEAEVMVEVEVMVEADIMVVAIEVMEDGVEGVADLGPKQFLILPQFFLKSVLSHHHFYTHAHVLSTSFLYLDCIVVHPFLSLCQPILLTSSFH